VSKKPRILNEKIDSGAKEACKNSRNRLKLWPLPISASRVRSGTSDFDFFRRITVHPRRIAAITAILEFGVETPTHPLFPAEADRD
jgi:hypothetical protein